MIKIKNFLFNKKNIIIFFYFLVSTLCNSTEKESLILSGNFEKENKFSSLPEYTMISKNILKKIINNGYWHLVLHNSAYAKVDLSNKNAHINIIRAGDTWYSIQFCYLPLLLEYNKNYIVEFSAKADKSRDMILEICQVGSWASYYKKTFRLTPDWQNFCFKFNMKLESNPQARFEFNLGGGGSCIDAYFDNVVIYEDTDDK